MEDTDIYAVARALKSAVREACSLIWEQDAAFVVGGPKQLDDWVARYGPLVDFYTGDPVASKTSESV